MYAEHPDAALDAPTAEVLSFVRQLRGAISEEWPGNPLLAFAWSTIVKSPLLLPCEFLLDHHEHIPSPTTGMHSARIIDLGPVAKLIAKCVNSF